MHCSWQLICYQNAGRFVDENLSLILWSRFFVAIAEARGFSDRRL